MVKQRKKAATKKKATRRISKTASRKRTRRIGAKKKGFTGTAVMLVVDEET